MVILGILGTAIIIIIFEVPPLLRKKMNKELWVFSVMLLIGVGLGLAKSLWKGIPNIVDLLTVVNKPIADLVLGLLK